MLRQKGHRLSPASRDKSLSAGITADFDDNGRNGIVAFGAQGWRCQRAFQLEDIMSSLKAKFAILAAGLMLTGCMQAATYEATNTANFKPRDKEYLAKIKYTNVPVAEPFRRAIVEYQRKEGPGSIVVDSEQHYLYYVLKDAQAIRYGITVGEEAMAWSGIAKIGNMTEWPPGIRHRARFRVSAFPLSWRRGRTIRWARARCICIRTARTRCSGFTAPISRNISAPRSPRAASASPTRTRSISITA